MEAVQSLIYTDFFTHTVIARHEAIFIDTWLFGPKRNLVEGSLCKKRSADSFEHE